MRVLKIGTRGSRLALWQTEWVARRIREKFPEIKIEIKIIKTKGDAILNTALSKIGARGLFTREIEDQLARGVIDLAVHSLKDMPACLEDEFAIGAVLPREIRQDALLVNKHKGYTSLMEMPPQAVIGTSSLRRIAQIKSLRPDLICVDMRGNVETRIRKMYEQNLDAIILAYAGIKRLGLDQLITEVISEDLILPAVGQGAIAVEIRKADSWIQDICSAINDGPSATEIKAERAFLAGIQGGCQAPVAGSARLIDKNKLEIKGLLSSLDGRNVLTHKQVELPQDAEELGRNLAEHLLAAGGKRLLWEIKCRQEP